LTHPPPFGTFPNAQTAARNLRRISMGPGRDAITRSNKGRDEDLAQVDRLFKLYSAVVSDVLDRLGFRNQVMAPHIRPLFPEAKLAGLAATVQAVDVDAMSPNRDDWYKGEMQAVDALKDGDVMVVSTTKGSYWGELLATAATYRKARGVVVDGYCRDSLALIEMRFPTFSAGILCSDSLGRMDVVASGVPITCGGVTVNAGDLVLADYDGVVVVPREAVDETLKLSEEKVAGENVVRDQLASGRPVWDTFKAYGVI